jgi:hypothetical protein
MVPITSPAVMALPFAAVAAGGLALLATRWLATRWLATRSLATRSLATRSLATRSLATRWLAGPGTSGRDPRSPAVTASFFLLVSALVSALNVSGVGAYTSQSYMCCSTLTSGSSTTTVPLVPGAVIGGCLAVAVGYGLQAALRLARRRPGSGARVLEQADRGGVGHAYV